MDESSRFLYPSRLLIRWMLRPSKTINSSMQTKAAANSQGLLLLINFPISEKFSSRLLLNKINSVTPMRTRRKRILKICFFARLDIPFPILSFLSHRFSLIYMGNSALI